MSDEAYRQLFSSPYMVRGLFDGIINEPWLDILDWQGLQPLPTDYITHRLGKRQSDLAWRIPRLDGADLYLSLMLEHQSQSERYMVLRKANYCTLFYENLLRRDLIPRNGRLPIVLPVVLYTGVQPWTAATSMSDMIDKAPPALQPYMLQMRYLLVDQGALVRSGKLPENNLAALLFRMEHNRGIDDVRNLMQTILGLTQGLEYAELRRAFFSWARYALLPRALPDVAIPHVENLLEISTMLMDQSRSWTHQWKMEGREEGRQEGRQEGEATLLQRQLTRKFGPLPETIEQRLQHATPAQLETWSLNILDAAFLDEVFSGQ